MLKRVTFKTFDYTPVDRKKILFTIVEKPYIHKNFIEQRHRYHRWYNIYKNQSGSTLVYFNPHKFPHFNTICTILGNSSLSNFPDVIRKLLDMKEQQKIIRRSWKRK